jgi:hypothetical protein
MVPATDSASISKTPARWGAIAIGLIACLTDLGCAQLSSFRQDKTPTLGSVARAQPGSSPGVEGDVYADRQRPNLAKSREALAQSQAKGRKPAPRGPADDTATLAKASETPSAPEEPADPPASRPLQVALEPPVGLSSRRNDLAMSRMPGERPRLKPAGSDAPAAPASAEPTPEALVSASRTRLDSLQSYQVTLNRQERVGETLQEPEEVLVSIKRDPRSVRLEWPSGPHKGREVIYLAAEDNGGSMHINAADSVIPVPPIKMPVNNPMVLRNARHPITEAGFETIVANMEKSLEATRAGDASHGTLTYAGLENPGALSKPCQKLVRVTPSGETWNVYIDPDTKLPAMVEATAQNGDLLERYIFSEPRVDPPELAAADAFAPDQRWTGSKGGGLLQRLARSGAAAPAATSTTR